MGFLLECRDFQKETREKSSLHVQTGLLCCYRQNSGVYISDGTRCAATLMTSRTPSINHQETVHLKEKEFQPRLTPTSASVWPLHSHLSMSPICLSQTAYNGAIWEAEIYERSGGGGWRVRSQSLMNARISPQQQHSLNSNIRWSSASLRAQWKSFKWSCSCPLRQERVKLCRNEHDSREFVARFTYMSLKGPEKRYFTKKKKVFS